MKNNCQALKGYLSNSHMKYETWLRDLVAIPSVSSQGFRGAGILEAADWLEQKMHQLPFDSIERLSMPDSAPYLIGKKNAAAGNAPTMLVYAHYDVQPIGDKNLWVSTPFEMTLRDGRFFARGAADDKAGVIGTLAAVDLLMSHSVPLPVNLIVLFDGEEECGSPHIQGFLKKYRQRLSADYLVVPDLVNPGIDQPSLTYSLRGLIEFKVTFAALKVPIHSGLSSGVCPDVTQAFAKMYAQAIGKKGEVMIPGVHTKAEPKMRKHIQKTLRQLKPKWSNLHKQMGLLPDVQFLVHEPMEFFENLWCRPALTLVHVQVAEKKNYANRLQTQCEAIFSLRIAPHQKPKTVIAALKKYFRAAAAFGCQVDFQVLHEASGFNADVEASHFQKALALVGQAYGKKSAVALGAGLSIPFVHEINHTLGPMVTLLLGIEDPKGNAHAENESISQKQFHQTILAMGNLMQGLGTR